MAGKIFINYRRGVNLKDAQLLQNVLHRHFGRSGVFLDVSGLDGGEHWLHTLERQVDDSVAMISLLGKGWVDLKDEKGDRRLDNPNDFVRFELARAFARNIPVLPVLIDGASMPELSELPSNLVPLTFPQAMLLRAESFDDDAEKIARRLKQLVAAARRQGISQWVAGAVAAAALGVGIVLGPLAFRAARLPPPWVPEPAGADVPRLLEEADRGRRVAEAKSLAALQAKAAAEKEAQARAMQVSRLEGLLAAEKEKVKTALGQIDTLKAQAEASKKAAGDAQARVHQLSQQLSAKGPDVTLLKQPREVYQSCIEIRAGNETRCLRPGAGKEEWFKDCPTCPEMVVVAEGTFLMGSPETEPERESWRKGTESPQHKVTIKHPFAVGRFAVTFDEWDACVAAGGCNGYRPDDYGWGRARRPVIMVSWHDAKAYVAWISKVTGRSYRLLSEAEREYVTRAGTTTPFWWGPSISTSQAKYGEHLGRTVPVDSYAPNPWGLYQVHGNVYEWVEDCWHENYVDAPTDGSAWTTGDCESHVLRGGAFFVTARNLRSANRSFNDPPTLQRTTKYGFRVARILDR